jgi:hypothetical protein
MPDFSMRGHQGRPIKTFRDLIAAVVKITMDAESNVCHNRERQSDMKGVANVIRYEAMKLL